MPFLRCRCLAAAHKRTCQIYICTKSAFLANLHTTQFECVLFYVLVQSVSRYIEMHSTQFGLDCILWCARVTINVFPFIISLWLFIFVYTYILEGVLFVWICSAQVIWWIDWICTIEEFGWKKYRILKSDYLNVMKNHNIIKTFSKEYYVYNSNNKKKMHLKQWTALLFARPGFSAANASLSATPFIRFVLQPTT